MIAFNILLLITTIGLLCWLVFSLAIYALPLLIGVTVGIWVHGSGADPIGAIVIGAVAAGAIFIIGQLVFSFARPPWIRLVVAALFVGPAAVAGYAATHGLAKHLMPSDNWQMAVSIVGAIAIGIAALARMAGTAPSESGMEHLRGS
ncbi:hypothetical protein [uncultured Tateyamaria sp.]|uniref:hypothetical protein n=1 Tax=uncultured Tateyamaria sp. TaxID=455651 RepID=UPI00262339E5|nr:hypothetical protein [uncultured Tateyamaria sp.]